MRLTTPVPSATERSSQIEGSKEANGGLIVWSQKLFEELHIPLQRCLTLRSPRDDCM